MASLAAPLSLPHAATALPGTPVSWLWRVAAALAVASLLTAFAPMLDGRLLGAASVWAKPLKFQLALAVHTATLAWALGHLPGRFRDLAMPRALAWLWIAVVLFEAAYITLQGARGTLSHFNRATGWEAAAGTLMATGAGLLVSITAWIGGVALWQFGRDRRGALMPLAIGLGFVLGAVLAAWTGSAMGAIRGHWPQPLVEPVLRLPLSGWVLSQPDWRIAHFIGLHQMQALPALVALGAWARWPRRFTLAALAAASLAAPVAVGLLIQP